MPMVNLSADFVSKAVCLEGKNKTNYYHKGIRGFLLEVRSSGGKTYALRYRDKHNRQCQYKLGNANEISFEVARKAAEKARGKVVLGEDPSDERRKKRKVPTLSYFIQFNYIPYIKQYKRSWKADQSMLKTHILPKLGKRHLNKITMQDISEFHHGMVSSEYAKGTANRGLVLLKYMFNLALKWNTPGVTENPAVGVKLFEANSRERFLTAEETQRLYAAIENSKNTQLKYIVPLLLLTGCRKRELLDSRWENFDLDRRIWRIPVSKSGKCRHVPLSKAALEILAQLPRFEGFTYEVPNPETLKPWVNFHRAWDYARKAAGLPDVRIHDLRHSMASNMINSGRSIYEVAKVLGHSQLKTSQRYAHLSQATLLEAVDAAAEATGTDWGQVQTG